MKPLNFFFIIGLQVLVLSHIAHTFVLLTANIEDVKKLAKKFVSDSIAEQIVEFMAKVNVNDDNISRENEENQKSSNEEFSNINNMLRSDTPTEEKPSQKKHDSQPDDSQREDELLQLKLLSVSKKYAKENKRKPLIKNVATTENHQDILKNVPSVIADYEAKLAHIMQAAKASHKIHRKPKINPASLTHESTVGYAVKYGQARNLAPNLPRFALMSNDGLYAALNATKTETKLGENLDKLTSRKVKTEFDQYDYTKQPQKRFVTSGREKQPKSKDEKEVETQTEWF